MKSTHIWTFVTIFMIYFGKTHSSDIYVNPFGNDTNGNGTQSGPFFSINRAVAQANPGDTIFLAVGNYSYDTPQVVNKTLNIVGGSSIPLQTILWNANEAFLPVLAISGAVNVTFRDLSILSDLTAFSSSAIVFDVQNAQNVTLRNFELKILGPPQTFLSPCLNVDNTNSFSLIDSNINASITVARTLNFDIINSTVSKSYDPDRYTMYVSYTVGNPSSPPRLRMMNSSMYGQATLEGVSPTITGCKFTNPKLNDPIYSGACLHVRESYRSEIRITDSTFERCETNGTGGGALYIYNVVVPVVVQNTEFKNCWAKFQGGSMFVFNATEGVTLIDTKFNLSRLDISSAAPAFGSALAVQYASLTMIGGSVTASTFSSGFPGAQRSAVSFNGPATFQGVVFSQNYGGSVQVQSGASVSSTAVSFDNCQFDSNDAAESVCAGISVVRQRTTITMTNSFFTQNQVSVGDASAAISIAAAFVNALVTNCSFSSNAGFSTTKGVVSLMHPDSVLVVRDSEFSSNFLQAGCGGIFVSGGRLELYGALTQFIGNTGVTADVRITTDIGPSRFIMEAGISFSQSASPLTIRHNIRLSGLPPDRYSILDIVPSSSGNDLAILNQTRLFFHHAIVNCTLVRCAFGSFVVESYLPVPQPTILVGSRGAEVSQLLLNNNNLSISSVGPGSNSVRFITSLQIQSGSTLTLSAVNAACDVYLSTDRAATIVLENNSSLSAAYLACNSGTLDLRSSGTSPGTRPFFEVSNTLNLFECTINLDRVDLRASGASVEWRVPAEPRPAFKLLAGGAPRILISPSTLVSLAKTGPQLGESFRFIEAQSYNLLAASSSALNQTNFIHNLGVASYSFSYENATSDAFFLILTTYGQGALTTCGPRPDGPFFYCLPDPKYWIGAGSQVFFNVSHGVYNLTSSIVSTGGAPFEFQAGSSIFLPDGKFLQMNGTATQQSSEMCPILPKDSSNPAVISLGFSVEQLSANMTNFWTLRLSQKWIDVPDECYTEIRNFANDDKFIQFALVPTNSQSLAQALNCSDGITVQATLTAQVFNVFCGLPPPVQPPAQPPGQPPPAPQPATPTNTAPRSETATQPALMSSTQDNSSTGAIVGGIIAVIIAVAALVLLAFFIKRQKHRKPTSSAPTKSPFDEELNEVPSTDVAKPVTAPFLVESEVPPGVPAKDDSADIIALVPGSIPLSDVTIMQELGKGSWGVVSLAVYKGEFVAIKRISNSEGAGAQQLATLMDEAKMMSSIKAHRNLVKFIGVCSDANSFGLMMEFCPRGSLSNYIRGNKGAALSEFEIFKFSYGVLEGMIALATVGLVHRDLAARNILLDERMFSKVSDFGSSRRSNQVDDVKKQDDNLGPVKWQPPEVLNDQSYSEKSDVWSFGCTVLELVTRREPYAGFSGNILQLMQDIKDGRINPLTHVEKSGGYDIKSWPEWIVPTLRSCFEQDPAKRPSFREIRFRITPKTRTLVDQYEGELDEIDSVLSTQHYAAVPSGSSDRINKVSSHYLTATGSKEASTSAESSNTVEILAGTDDVADLGSVERLGKLGAGSFGTVYLGKFKGQYVAIKVLNLTSAGGQAVLREAEVMSAISQHRNIVQLFGIVKNSDQIDIVMEFAPKGSCEDYVTSFLSAAAAAAADNRKKTLMIGEALLFKWALGIARGMTHLTSSKVIHRDLSARNVLLDSSLEPKIADFGLGRTVLDPNQESSTQTDVGPLRWFAPECFDLKYSEKTDVWAYGCTLIELATGAAPFPDKSVIEVAVAVRDQGATALDGVPEAKRSAFPSWFLETVQKSLMREAKDRPTFAELVSFLESKADTIDEIREAEAAIQRRRNKRAGTVIQ